MKVALPLPVAEWRALFSEGPATALVAKDDAVALLDRVLELEARLEVAPTHPYDGIACRDETIRQQDRALDHLRALLADARASEEKWIRSSMAQERRAIRAEAEMQRLKDAIRALLEPDGLQGRGA